MCGPKFAVETIEILAQAKLWCATRTVEARGRPPRDRGAAASAEFTIFAYKYYTPISYVVPNIIASRSAPGAARYKPTPTSAAPKKLFVTVAGTSGITATRAS
jgi:hypothetical protein